MRIGNRTLTAGVPILASRQEAWQILSQWMWNLRLDLGHRLQQTPMRTTEFAPAQPPPDPAPQPSEPASVIYGPPQWAKASQMGGFAGDAFTPQPDGTLRCPAGSPCTHKSGRPERDGSVRVLYAARVGHCRMCALRESCQGYGIATKKPRRVSAVLWPMEGPSPEPAASPALPPASHPILWGDWSRCQTRREWMQLLRSQRVDLLVAPSFQAPSPIGPSLLSRAERAHWRLSWKERLARNVRSGTAPSVEVTVFGLPSAIATFLGLPTI